MLLYEFQFVHDDNTVSSANHCFRDDLDALDAAAKRVAKFDVHIWQDGHWIAWVKKGNAPLDDPIPLLSMPTKTQHGGTATSRFHQA